MSGEDGYSSSSSSDSSRSQWIDEFEDFCSSEDLSLDGLQRMTKDISLDDLRNSSFLHRVCMNEKVTLEIVECLLHLYPQTIHRCLDISYEYKYIPDEDSVEGYPLHLACYNKDCPNEVIQLLLRKSSGHFQINHMCRCSDDWGNSGAACLEDRIYDGTPLHYYLSRTSNVDLDIVKQLVANPGMLLLADEETKFTPIHILLHNESIGEMFDVVKYLAEANPSSLKAKDHNYQIPLHVACDNSNITTRIIEVLLKLWPESACQQEILGALPIHLLCGEKNKKMDDEIAIDVLKLLLDAYPDSVRKHIESGYSVEFPIHRAARNMPPGCCKLLYDAYPRLVRLDSGRLGSGVEGSLPFHFACYSGRPDTLEYLFGIYPKSLHKKDYFGHLPIHMAVCSPNENAPEIIKFLFRHDPECLSKPFVADGLDDYFQKLDGCLPLHIICNSWDKSGDATELVFDLYPEAIYIRNKRGQLPIDIVRQKSEQFIFNPRYTNKAYKERNREVLSFISSQMRYARKAQDGNAMRTPEGNGLLPLHNAIRDRASLGTIKLLVKGNPCAINTPDNSERLPLGIASEVSTVGVVKYLVDLVPDRLNTCDTKYNYLLHHACRGGNCKVIQYLLERPKSSASVSERNACGMLPIHLFCKFVNEQEEQEVEEDDEEDTTEYTETIWRLLIAYPETVLNW